MASEQDEQIASEIADKAIPPEQHGVKAVVRELVAAAIATEREKAAERMKQTCIAKVQTQSDRYAAKPPMQGINNSIALKIDALREVKLQLEAITLPEQNQKPEKL